MSDDADGAIEALLALASASAGPGTLAAGSLVGERYRVTRFIARGGMGAVYEATGPTGMVAIKTLVSEVEDSPEARRRFEREAQAMSRLSHPGIVGVEMFGTLPDGAHYLVMELVDGGTLRQRFEAGIDSASAVALVKQVLAALDYAHAMGVVHRDLKPENVLIGADGRAKVLDFGIAKMIGDAAAEMGGGKLTRTGVVCGTPDYISPEQALGRPVDGRSDLYTVGVILYEALAGRRPFVAEDPMDVMRMHAAVPAPPFERTAPERGVPEALAAACLRALAKKPPDRFANAREMLLALG